MGQRFVARERREFSNGAVGWAPGGQFDCIGPYAKVQNCPVDGTDLRLTCYATGTADTFFSVPACTRHRGRHIGGFFAHDRDGGVVFTPLAKFRHLLMACMAVVLLAAPAAADPAMIATWPGGVMPVQFSPAADAVHRERFFAACAEWGRHAGVACVPYGGQLQWVEVTAHEGSGCTSGYGPTFPGWPQRMNLEVACYTDHATLVHEIGHALGFKHEHQRADRDQFIEVRMDHVVEAARFAYERDAAYLPPGPYDFKSILHYADNAFGDGFGPTFVPRRAVRAGGARGVSVLDGIRARAFYGPPRGALMLAPPRVRVRGSEVALAWDAVPGAVYTLMARDAAGAVVAVFHTATPQLVAQAPAGTYWVTVAVRGGLESPHSRVVVR